MTQIVLHEVVIEQQIVPRRYAQLFWVLKQCFYLLIALMVLSYYTFTFFKVFDYYNTIHESREVDIGNPYAVSVLTSQIHYLEERVEELQSLNEEIDLKIENALKRYDADKIGVFDYAAEYAGGSIISTPKTEPLTLSKQLKIFGVSLSVEGYSKPQFILQQSTQPGQCFAFKGNRGRIRIKLGEAIVVGSITMEHSLLGGKITAPKEFQVIALKDPYDENGIKIVGEFTFNIKETIQTFPIEHKEKVRFLELFIKNNYGGDFTCIYRFRVHSMI